MTATILSLPHCRAALASVPLRTYDLETMARLMGWQHDCRRTIIARLRALASTEGLPLPSNQRLRKARLCHGPAAIDARSFWDAQLVDAWLHHPGPAAPAMAAPALPLGTHRIMADRAMQLVAGGVR